jgi:hypothetical protein
MGSMGDYANFAFYALLCASILACMAAVCGCLTCKCTHRAVAVCFGLTLLPAAAVILVFGIVLTGISHSDEQDLRSFCVDDYEEFQETSGKDEWMKKLRDTVEEVDYTVGSLVSQMMCSAVCPCDVDDIPLDVQEEWLDIFTDNDKLEEFDRCTGVNTGDACSDEQQVIYMIQGRETILEMTGFDIQAYKTF